MDGDPCADYGVFYAGDANFRDSDTVLDFSNAMFDFSGHYTYWNDLTGSCEEPASPPSPFALPLDAYTGTFNDETLTYAWHAEFRPRYFRMFHRIPSS